MSRGFPSDVRELILARSGGDCEAMIDRVCTYTATDIHHRRARGMGGSDRDDTNLASNGVALCRRCHESIERRRDWARDYGFLVMQNQIPKDAPIWWRCARVYRDGSLVKAWRLLSNDGSMQLLGTEDTVRPLW